LHAFVDHLADAYLIYPIFIHSRSERVRKVNPQKVYLVDTGLLAAASMNITADRGAFLENLIFLSIRRKGDIVEYFHDGGGVETDFVVRDPMSGSIKDLIQVTWSLDNPQTYEREFRGLLTAMDKLNFNRGTIVVWTNHGNIKKQEGVTIIPAWRYLLGVL
jgi:predicted AAA+ superfamily ATPase